MSVVTLEHVTKRFYQNIDGARSYVTPIDDISMKIHEGEVLAILGPSGCGKSTFLRLIAGLETPDKGEILFDNIPLDQIEIKDRGIGMVFQEGALMPHWEGWRTVGFFLTLRQREDEVPARVHRVSEVTGIGLEKLLAKKPRHLSGGERQRVGIARALARDPRVFLFDEPFSNLDAKIRSQSRVELKRLLQEFPVTSVYVTHDQIEAIALADRIGVMRDGKIEQVDTYHDLYHNPVNLFVGTFISTPLMNTFEGEVVDGLWQGTNFGGYRLRSDLDTGTRVTLGIRPEFMVLGPEGVGATVEHVTMFLPERYKLLAVRGNREHWEVTAPLDYPVEAGDTIHCTADSAGLLFFDTKTGRRIG
ncbi:MAG: ABC transporter ATP-binding protein [Anaerolineae bacterium]|nr:ABC transporter ATP-binding protein [Anaerolineae bacterium]